jgi:16S rRNA (adenine1518-N6/adenine1519-N6)-dimethyltransferase
MSGLEPRARTGKWRALIEQLEALGFQPSRGRGQNFLFDDAMLEAIASDARLDGQTRVLEIGPGCGILTERLVARAPQVLAVELDPRLAGLTRRRLSGAANLELIEGDALDGKHALHPEVVRWTADPAPWSLVANLPYSVGTPILVACSRLEHPPESMTVLLQAELVERIVAQPSGDAWGAVSAKLQLLYGAERVRRVGPQMFWPRPKVDSAVARLVLRPNRPEAARVAEFDALVTHLFAQRRKTLRSRLADLLGDREAVQELCASLALDGGRRPEQLSVSELAALSTAVGRLRG